MHKYFANLISIIWWLWVAFAATGLSLIIGLSLARAMFNDHYSIFAVLFGLGGFVAGISWAEHSRKTNGFDKYFGAVTGAPTKDQNMNREDY